MALGLFYLLMPEGCVRRVNAGLTPLERGEAEFWGSLLSLKCNFLKKFEKKTRKLRSVDSAIVGSDLRYI